MKSYEEHCARNGKPDSRELTVARASTPASALVPG